VGKTAVYRRWASKLELVLEMVTELAGKRLPLPDTGSLRGDLEAVLSILARALRHPLASQIIPDLLAEAARNPRMAQTLHESMRVNQLGVGTTLIGRAIQRGELPAGTDPDAAVDMIVGPLYWRLAVARTPLPEGHLAQLADAVVAALRATAGMPPAATSSAGTDSASAP
jgi:AcrR family transcriptional regulator